MTEWDKLWEHFYDNIDGWIYDDDANSYIEAFEKIKAVGDKLQDEAEANKQIAHNVEIMLVQTQEENKQLKEDRKNLLTHGKLLREHDAELELKLEAIRGIANTDITAKLSKYPNMGKTPAELLDMVIELKERHSKILEVLGDE